MPAMGDRQIAKLASGAAAPYLSTLTTDLEAIRACISTKGKAAGIRTATTVGN